MPSSISEHLARLSHPFIFHALSVQCSRVLLCCPSLLWQSAAPAILDTRQAPVSPCAGSESGALDTGHTFTQPFRAHRCSVGLPLILRSNGAVDGAELKSLSMSRYPGYSFPDTTLTTKMTCRQLPRFRTSGLLFPSRRVLS